MIRRALALGAGAVLALLALGFLGRVHPALDTLSVGRLHAGLVALVLLPLAFLAGARLARWLLLLALLLALAGLLPYAIAAPATRVGAGGPAEAARLKLISFNLNLANRAAEAVTEWIGEENPGIVALQEVSADNISLLSRLGDAYPAQMVCRFTGYISTAILTRLPETDPPARGCLEEQGLAWMRVEGPRGPVTIASLHLRWPWPYGQDRQIAAVEPVLRDLPRPVVLAGDFNAMPWAAAVSRIAEASGTRRLDGILPTLWRPGLILPLPIDHVLAHPDFGAAALSMGPDLGSDHRPVRAVLY